MVDNLRLNRGLKSSQTRGRKNMKIGGRLYPVNISRGKGIFFFSGVTEGDSKPLGPLSLRMKEDPLDQSLSNSVRNMHMLLMVVVIVTHLLAGLCRSDIQIRRS